MSNLQTIQSLDLFLTVIAITALAIIAITALATVIDEILWWALPAAAKVAIKTLEWRVEVIGAQIAVWEYNNYNRLARRWTNWLTLWLRAQAEVNMRSAINHAETRLETLSLLLNGIQQ